MAHGNGGVGAICGRSAPWRNPRYATAAHFMVLFVSVLWLAFGAVFIVVATFQPGIGLYFKLPQWVLLLPVGLLGVLGANNSFKPKPLRGSA